MLRQANDGQRSKTGYRVQQRGPLAVLLEGANALGLLGRDELGGFPTFQLLVEGHVRKRRRAAEDAKRELQG
jgi:hypothetical protein